MAEEHDPPVPSWQTYRHQDVWQKFVAVYVTYGFLVALTIFESIGALQQHNGWLFLVPASLSVFAAFILTRAMYRQIWLFGHSREPLSRDQGRLPVTPKGRTGER